MRARKGRRCDRSAIEELVRRARHASPSLWEWKPFVDHGGFIVTEERNRVCGVLCASADKSPVAWVRLAAVEYGFSIGRWLDLSLPGLVADLRDTGVQELVWMDSDRWAGPYLVDRGFRLITEVITLVKIVSDSLDVGMPGLTLRPAQGDDLEAVATIDKEAFRPYWWRSVAAVQRRAAAGSTFMAAEYDGRMVGYVEWELRPPTAHLNRIAVGPNEQGRGVGRALLGDALGLLWRRGVEKVSLNTQRDNWRARRLYDAFGFRPTGDVAPVWGRQLEDSAKGG